MKTYVQYDENGDITATVTGTSPPDHPRQIEVDPATDVRGKRVRPATRKLEDAPAPAPADGTPEKFARDWPYGRLIDALADPSERAALVTAAVAVKAGMK